MIAWPSGVNQTIYGDTTWSHSDGLIRDTMRSGKDKKRLESSSIPDTFSVVMYFTKEEYELFDTWFKVTSRRGLYPFYFPKIAGTGTGAYEIYGGPSYSSPGGNIVKCTMTWRTA